MYALALILLELQTKASPAQDHTWLARSQREVQDMASIDLRRIAHGEQELWVMATMTPSPTSGHYQVEGQYIDADTGKLVTPENATAHMFVEGTLLLHHLLEGRTEATEWRYKWDNLDGVGSPEDGHPYSPLRTEKATVLCQVVESQVGPSMLPFIYVVAEERTESLLQAHQWWSKLDHDELTARELDELLSSENPFQLIAGLRECVKQRTDYEDRVSAVLKGSKETTQALVAFWLLSHPTLTRPEFRSGLAGDLVDEATHASDIIGLAIGAHAAVALRDHLEESASVLRMIKLRMSYLDMDSRAGDQLREVVQSPMLPIKARDIIGK